MAQIRKSFIDSYLNNRLLDAVKCLNQVLDAIDTKEEQKLVAEIDDIRKRILSIQI